MIGCGRCDACRRAVTFSDERPRSPHHPDVMIIERAFYPPETFTPKERGDADLDRADPDDRPRPRGLPGARGRARVFIVRRAEELSVGAANAMLKTLEEPRNGTHFILLTARPDRLLNTIRSRTLPVRFAPLPDEVVRSILRAQKIPEERHELAVELAAGSASTALELVDEERTALRDAFVSEALAAVSARDLGLAVAFAESRDKDKDQLRTTSARSRLAGAAGAAERRSRAAHRRRRGEALRGGGQGGVEPRPQRLGPVDDDRHDPGHARSAGLAREERALTQDSARVLLDGYANRPAFFF